LTDCNGFFDFQGIQFGCYTVEEMPAILSPRSAFSIALEGIGASTDDLDYDGWDDDDMSATTSIVDDEDLFAATTSTDCNGFFDFQGIQFGCYTVEEMPAIPSPRSAFSIALEGIGASTDDLDYDGWDDDDMSATTSIVDDEDLFAAENIVEDAILVLDFDAGNVFQRSETSVSAPSTAALRSVSDTNCNVVADGLGSVWIIAESRSLVRRSHRLGLHQRDTQASNVRRSQRLACKASVNYRV
jgi:hypothetical protein